MFFQITAGDRGVNNRSVPMTMNQSGTTRGMPSASTVPMRAR